MNGDRWVCSEYEGFSGGIWLFWDEKSLSTCDLPIVPSCMR